eukprot:TRINITY_DN909_c0_g1_i1.p1 TRINITY_DN909_c0_g1~~TRINITY_DN909_c0_g1_i1.p1  ORF type:complete len:200 (-),score=27.91 TRINITY_DN909_c0_g1_i1:3140-3739(-)
MQNANKVAFSSTGFFIPRRSTFPSVPHTHSKAPPLFLRPTAEMVRVSVPLKVEAPNRYCFQLFSDLSSMSEWSSTLEAVERDAEDPSFSEWKFAWNGIRLSWRAKDVKNIQEETSDIPAIRWKSVSGLVHTGAVLFEDMQQGATNLVMTVEYDIESLLATIMRSSMVSSFIEGAIESDLSQFRSYALRKYRKARMSGEL